MFQRRVVSFVLAGFALAAASAAHAAPNWVPLTQQTAGSLRYAGSLSHPGLGTAHTFLAPTMAACSAMLAQSQQQHDDGHASCPAHAHYVIDPCGKRGFFELVAPNDGGGDDGVTTVMVHLPSEVVRELGGLRERYRIDAYEADIAKLGEE